MKSEETPITIKTPLNFQVVQRNAEGKAKVKISGTIKIPAAKIEARLTQAYPMVASSVVPWHIVTTDIEPGAWAGTIEIPQGWWLLDVRARDGAGLTLAEGKMRPIGVGEVFVIAGQSNSANYGSELLKPKNNCVTSFTGLEWAVGNDPQLGATGDGGSPWPALGDMLVEELQVPIGFVSVGVGATGSNQWLPDAKNTLYVRIQKAVQGLGPDGARALLWHQGESDALTGTSAETYCDRLTQIIKASRKDAGFELPWIVARASYSTHVGKDKMDPVRSGQSLLWESKIALEGPDTDDMQGDLRATDLVHFSGKGLREHAKRWFEILNKHFHWKKGS